jgi:KaiC/GvpD/RAD55 family RecA-like ATPase
LAGQPASKLQDAVKTNSEFPLKFGSILEKGFPKGCTISLFGPVGVGKTVFCENLAKGFLNSGAGCVYISTERAPADIRNDFRTLRADVDRLEIQEKLKFIDGYSWLAGGSAETYRVENLANLSELTITIEKAYTSIEKEELIILDSVSPLCLHNPEDDVTKFLQSLAARTKGWGAIGIFAVQAGVHSQEFYNALAYLVDGMFELRQNEEGNMIKRYFRIRNLRFSAHEVGWMPFIIEAGRGFKLEKESQIPK